MSKNERINSDYYIGLDIGTDSVGWAVTDTDYRLLKFKGEPMWGAHLFEAGKQAAERRSFRTARRRLDRRQQRVKLVQELFASEIAKVDPSFYNRIKASALVKGDKGTVDPSLVDETNCIFSDEDFGDKEFHKKYPTIHHLIVDLMDLDNTGEAKDIRLYYLACAWLVAHRGHFLSEIDGNNIEALTDIGPLYDDFKSWFVDRGLDQPWSCATDAFADILNKKIRISDKEKQFAEIIFGGKAPKDDPESFPISISSLLKLFAGGETQVKKIFIADDELSESTEKISLRMDEESLEAVLATLGDYAELIVIMKRIYDSAVLKELQNGRTYISEAKVDIYKKHKQDLVDLKHVIKTYVNAKYDDLFREGTDNSYSAYVGNFKSVSGNKKLPKSASKEDFYKNIKGILNDIDPDKLTPNDKECVQRMLSDIELGLFMPKQVTGDNRVIPRQLYYAELKRLLSKASSQYAFLTKKEEGGLTVEDKLLSIFNFRVPYFVGPLNSHSDYAWLERKAEGKILPWNIQEKVDFEKSEQAFIDRMTNTCTYLPGKDVLPRWSLLYTRYTVLNEINNITIDGKKISVELKQAIYNDLFRKNKKVTMRALRNYLKCNVSGFSVNDSIIGGIDININASLKSWVDFQRLLESKKLTQEDVERIIAMSTYTEDSNRFRKWLSNEFKSLDNGEGDLKYVSKLKYSEFGRLSAELLNGIEGVSKQTGEIGTVMYFLWNTNDNLMQIIKDEDRYTFAEIIKKERDEAFSVQKSLNEKLEEMGISNAVKRPIYRTLDVVSDIVKAEKHPPKKIFIEMARGATDEQKNKRTVSRTNQLKDLYKAVKTDEAKALSAELDKLGIESDKKLQSQKLYLYYLQMGKCMYCGEPIDLSSINNTQYCDIDHIWPRAYVKDDSLTNNKVLVHSTENGKKGDTYPLPAEWRIKMDGFWRSLNSKGLINDEKLKRLTRSNGFSNDEKMGFINRQLVETRQSTKAIAELLGNKFGDSTEIVFVKAALASEFRHDFGDIKDKALNLHLDNVAKKELELVKCRSINDTHHAKDAYLNIVAGNVYNTKFTKRFFDVSSDRYSLNNRIIFGTPTKDGKTWAPEKHVPIVEKMMSNDHIHLTKYQTCQKGGFFDMQPVKASDGLVPLKKGENTAVYGGYNKPTATFFTLVSHQLKNKKELTFIPVDLLVADRFKTDKEFALEYVQNVLGSKSSNIQFPLGDRVLKVNTVLSLDGFRVCLAGKDSGGARILTRSLTTCHYSKESLRYVKDIDKVIEKKKENKNYEIDRVFDNIDESKNLKLLMEFADKLNLLFAKMPGSKITLQQSAIEHFKDLSLNDQVQALSSIVLYLKTNRAGACDATGFGGASKTGVLYLNASLSNWIYSDVHIIDCSPSGLFESKSINLKELL